MCATEPAPRRTPEPGCLAARPVVALDLDGVVVDSEPVKLAAFLDALRSDVSPTQLASIDGYNRSHRGIPRAQKFETIARSIFGVPPEAQKELVDGWADRYARALEAREAEVQRTAGVEALLALGAFRFAVVSSAPRAEIVRLLRRLSLLASFDEIHGYPETKATALTALNGRDLCVFLGDAVADADAARTAGVPFVCVGSAWQAASAVDHPVVRSLTEPSLVPLLVALTRAKPRAAGPEHKSVSAAMSDPP